MMNSLVFCWVLNVLFFRYRFCFNLQIISVSFGSLSRLDDGEYIGLFEVICLFFSNMRWVEGRLFLPLFLKELL